MRNSVTTIVVAGLAVGRFGGFSVAGPPTTGPALSAPQSFDEPNSVEAWSFSNGPEWPGATGALERRAHDGRQGDGVLVLRYDFERGGNYVAALAALPADPPVQGVRLWVNKPAGNVMIFRAVDRDNETFQKELSFDYQGWQQLEIGLDGWVHHWGGDGQFVGPARRFDILIENRGGNRRGELLIDDVQWMYQRLPPDAERVATATYTESSFTGDGWTCRGPEGTELRGDRWSYRFTPDANECRLLWEKSILGRPSALRLTVDSDGSGHELRVVCGSHFQSFERMLGTLDTPGTHTFAVPMGDMTTWQYSGGENDGIVRYPLRLEYIRLAKKGAANAGELGLVRLEFVTEYERDQPVSLVPRVAEKDANQLRFTVELRSLHDTPLVGQIRYTINAFDRTIERGSVPVVVPPQSRTQVERVVARAGHAMIEGVFEFGADRYTSGPCSVTIAQVPEVPGRMEPDPNSAVGVGLYLYRFHEHPDAKTWMQRMCRLAVAAGVKWTREEFHWNWIEPTRGTFDFRFFDQLVETAVAHGISIYGLMCYYTEWNKPPVTDEFIENYCNYLRVVVGRYKDRIKHWEIWNEPNIFFWPGPRERYPVLLRRAYQTIKEVDPAAQVLGCSTAGIDTAFIKMVLEHDAPFDALTVHPYRGDLDPRGFVRELRSVRDLVGGRDVWITEMGWPSHLGGLTEREQAGYVARTYIAALASGAVRSIAWYDFREDGTDPFYNEHHFGLVREDLTPKIGYQALAAVGQLLGRASYVSELEADEHLTGFVFRAGDRYVAALWSIHDTRVVRLRLAPENARVFNAANEPAAGVRSGPTVTLRALQNMPVYIMADELPRVTVLPVPVEVRLDHRSVHPGGSIRIHWRAEPDLKVGPLVPPLGWTASTETSGDEAVLVVPAWASPGDYSVRIPIDCEGVPLDIPATVQVVPELLRG